MLITIHSRHGIRVYGIPNSMVGYLAAFRPCFCGQVQIRTRFDRIWAKRVPDSDQSESGSLQESVLE